MGEEKSVLRVGGLAGLLAGVVTIVNFIVFAVSPPPVRGLEEGLAAFPERSTVFAVTTDLNILAILLFIALLAALYVSLKETSHTFARIGLGLGVLGFVVGIFSLEGTLLAANAFGGLYADAAVSDRPAIVAAFAVVRTLLRAGDAVTFLLVGFAFVAFGLAMRRSQDFGEGLAWLTAVLGIIIVLGGFLLLTPLAIFPLLVLAFVLGWKVYSLSRTA